MLSQITSYLYNYYATSGLVRPVSPVSSAASARSSPSDEELLELQDNRKIVLPTDPLIAGSVAVSRSHSYTHTMTSKPGTDGTVTGTLVDHPVAEHAAILSRIDSKDVDSSVLRRNDTKTSGAGIGPTNTKNHQIVAIQAGLIEVDVSKDEQEGAHKLPSFTKFCICTADHKTGMLPVLWTCVVVMLALILPIISFASDIFIYIEGNSISHSIYWWSRSPAISRMLTNDYIQNISETYDTPNVEFNTACLSAKDALLWQKREQEDKNRSLKAYQHNLSALFQPCLIIGTVLSVGLTIFLRLVMLGCGHRNLRSAIAAVFLYSLSLGVYQESLERMQVSARFETKYMTQ